MSFGRQILAAFLGQVSPREARAARARLLRKPSITVQPLEGRMLLSHAGALHLGHSSSAIVSALGQKHGRGHDDGARHHTLDHKGGHGQGKDDGARHDVGDDHGSGRGGQDDPAGHDANDDRGGHGKDDGAGHK